MARRRFVVRIICKGVKTKDGDINYYLTDPHTEPPLNMLLFEQLRYAGLANIVSEDEARVVIELYPPMGVESEVWSRQNAERMRTFLIDAVNAPRWGG